jgi:hypothetical protein
MDTFMAANSVLAQEGGGFWTRFASMVAIITTGIANVKSILAVKPSSSNSASVPAPAALSTAPIEYTRNLLGDKETEKLNNPIKCYVLESDISDTQNKVQVTESSASF